MRTYQASAIAAPKSGKYPGNGSPNPQSAVRNPHSRRGQTLILALSILFLMVVLGGIFVTMLLQNLSRVSRQTKTDDALTLALAGIQHAAVTFRNSPDGADWRPQPTETLWETPTPPASIAGAAALRLKDPDYQWLSDNGSYQNPYVRFSTGRGRFLLRVTYLPHFQYASAASEAAGTPDVYDPNSDMIHIESIGRPGEFDPNDPTFFTKDPTNGTNGIESFRKAEAYVPVGLASQLWWITNLTNEHGPATLGVPPYEDGNGNTVVYPALYEGGIRSNVDLRFDGRSVIRLYPSRGEGLLVKGQITLAPPATQGNLGAGQPQVRIDLMADSGGPSDSPQSGVITVPKDTGDDDPANDIRVGDRSLVPSANMTATDPIPMLNNGDAAAPGGSNLRYAIQDEGHWRSDALIDPRSTRLQAAPNLDQVDATTGIPHWLKLTRDSGATVQVTDLNGNNPRIVNTGWYGLTDQSFPADLRARGLYIDNFDDIQYPGNRPHVKDEWLHRDPKDPAWVWGTYTPVIMPGSDHPNRQKRGPITDVAFVTGPNGLPMIRVTRLDPDVRQLNVDDPTRVKPTNPRKQYYAQQSGSNYQLVPAGYDVNGNRIPGDGSVRYFDIPENGVIYAEGSISVHGVYGASGLSARPLTVVSGGSIYINGNLVQFRGGQNPVVAASGWHIALLAHDNVVLNPTSLTGAGTDPFGWGRISYAGGVTAPAGDPRDPQTPGFYSVQPGGELNYTVNTAFDTQNPANSLALFLKHSGQYQDNLSTTHLTLSYQIGATTNVYDWDANRPTTPPGYWQASSNPAHPTEYLFQFLSQPGPSYVWSESNYQSPPPAVRFESKLFDLGNLTVQPGQDITFKLQPGLNTYPNEQDYLLSRIALLPKNNPLPMRVEASVYAFHGSWFVIPPVYFNENSSDTRAAYLSSTPNQRPQNSDVSPSDSDVVPFYHEPLNVDIQMLGSITENMPAEPTEKATWVSRTWTSPGTYDPSDWPPQSVPAFRPNLRYRYDGDLRRLVRVRILRPYQLGGTLHDEEVAWAGPLPSTRRNGIRDLQTVVGEALTNNSYAQVMPLFPHLPASTVVYEGNPL